MAFDITRPAEGVEAVTPSDATNLTNNARGLYVGVTGNVSVVTITGDTAVFVGVPAGSIIPLRIKRVNSTSTTATDMVALY